LYCKTPFSLPFAASWNALLIDSTVADRVSSTVRSMRETFGVGTRMAVPFSLPFSSGMTSKIAFAAPVDAGIMESAAARARRKSSCGRSRMRWSFV